MIAVGASSRRFTAACCLAFNEFGGQHNALRLCVWVINLVQQQLGSLKARLKQLLPNGGKVQIFRQFDIVIADEGEVIWYGDVEFFGGA